MVVVSKKRETYKSRANLYELSAPDQPLASPPMNVPNQHQCMGCYVKFKEERHMLSHQTQVRYCRDAIAAMDLHEHLDAFIAAIDDFEGLDSDPENDGGDLDPVVQSGCWFDESHSSCR